MAVMAVKLVAARNAEIVLTVLGENTQPLATLQADLEAVR